MAKKESIGRSLIALPTPVNDLLKLRALQSGLTISEFLLEVLLTHIPPPSDQERVFLPSGAQHIESYQQWRERAQEK